MGGTHAGYLAAVVVLEEMARMDIRFAYSSNQQSGTCPASIYLAGTQQQITARLLPTRSSSESSVSRQSSP